MKSIQEQSEEIYKTYADSKALATSNFKNAIATAKKTYEEILFPLEEIYYEAKRKAHETLTNSFKELQDQIDLTNVKVIDGKRYRLISEHFIEE